MLDVVLLASGAIALVIGTLFTHLERWSISPPMLGLVGGILVGPEMLDAVSIPIDEHIPTLRIASRLLLAVALMAIALRYPFEQVRARRTEVALLILIVLPAMAGIVSVGAAWTLQVPVGVAVVLGAALSPTDPVLASGVATGTAAERDIPSRGRQVLSLESGINDGLALPLVMLAIAWTLDLSLSAELGRATIEVIGAIVVGAAVGTLAGRALGWAEQHREIGPSIRSLYTLVLAATLLGLSDILHIDDLLSVFVAGLAHNRVVSGADRESEVALDETLNQFLVIPVFVLLGVVLPWAAWGELGWRGPALVLIALGLRRLPIMLALKRPARAGWPQMVWQGWFGPIGVAGLYYLTYAHDRGVSDPAIWAAGTLVVAASTLVHGLTAAPSRLLYRRSTTTR